jgi:hypothetical protein
MSDQGGANSPDHAQVPAPVPTARGGPDRWKWRLRAVGALVAVLAFAGTWVGFNATELRAKLAARRLASAATDEERAARADALIGLGAPGLRNLVECARTGPDPVRAAACDALDRHLQSLPDGDTRAVTIAGAVLEACSGAEGTRAVLPLVGTILNRTGGAHAQRCRVLVVEALRAPELETRLLAARLAIHPEMRLRADLIPLLGAPEPELRKCALFAVATADEPLLTDENLFRWLNDPDPGVRRVCRDVLVGRDRSDAEIALGRRLTHPDPTERLKLLIDLRYDHDVPDPEPWLERLSRDPEPAIRAGAARVAVEVAALHELTCPAWVARVADGDQHPTVRFIAAHYRSRPLNRPVRPVQGPE